MRFRPFAFALSFVLGVVVLVAMGQISVAPRNLARVEYYARPQDMVQIKQGTPYVVPSGALLVLTALGTDQGRPNDSGLAQLFLNGQLECSVAVTTNQSQIPSAGSIAPAPMGRAFPEGSTLTVSCNNGALAARAWGYLCSVNPPAANVVRVLYQPHPSQFVEISGGSTFTVPPGKLLVITALGGTTGGPPFPTHALEVDGVIEMLALQTGSYVTPPAVPVPVGLAAQTGSVVEVQTSAVDQTVARAWGYLADV